MVRGPITAEYVERNNGVPGEVYGDPGLIAPFIYKPERKLEYRYGIISHFKERCEDYDADCLIISPRNDWRYVVEQISRCEVIVSSSLHGVVFADAYGIECRLVKPVHEGIVKYVDYFAGIDKNIKIFPSIERAIQGKSVEIFCGVKLKKVQSNIISAFSSV